MMDYSKATNQELYEIAMDEDARMKDRYKATKELQRRKGEADVQVSRMSESSDKDMGHGSTM